MSPEPTNPPHARHTMRLIDRALMLRRTRSFFQEKGILEVDCFALLPTPALDTNIEAVKVSLEGGKTGYLHTSPEYAMKRLLVQGMPDIFYLGHVFRKEETGRLHNIEFSMIEWYRLSMSFETLIAETCELIRLFLGSVLAKYLSYRDAFLTYCGVDPFVHTSWERTALSLGLHVSSDCALWDADTWQGLLLTHVIEPKLGRDELTILHDYPPSQAALAQVVTRGAHDVAERFEIYFEGVELCNGYHELSCAKEQRRRFEEANLHRELQGALPYPLDEDFLAALKEGLPDCCGVSVGFDRLMLLRQNCERLQDVLPYPRVITVT